MRVSFRGDARTTRARPWGRGRDPRRIADGHRRTHSRASRAVDAARSGTTNPDTAPHPSSAPTFGASSLAHDGTTAHQACDRFAIVRTPRTAHFPGVTLR